GLNDGGIVKSDLGVLAFGEGLQPIRVGVYVVAAANVFQHIVFDVIDGVGGMDRGAGIDAVIHGILQPVVLDGVSAAAVTVLLAKDQAIQGARGVVAIDGVVLDRAAYRRIKEDDRVIAVGTDFEVAILDGGIAAADLHCPAAVAGKVEAIKGDIVA